MNPFNHEPLTKEQLDNECLCFLSINQKPVKSSRLFMGHIHDVNLERLVSYFKVDKNYYKKLSPNEQLIQKLSSESNGFFLKGVPDDYIDREADISGFGTFEEAYHRLVLDLANLNEKAIRQILPEKNDIRNIYISGGFSKNEIFVSCLARKFKNHRIFTSEFENSSAMGAALMVFKELGVGDQPEIDLGLKEWKV